jgi:hypothetical protein
MQSDKPLPFKHRAYGLTIHSDFFIPELHGSGGDKADVEFLLRKIDAPPNLIPGEPTVSFAPDRYYLAWSRIGEYLICGPDSVHVSPAAGADNPLIDLPLLGIVSALLLHRRGTLVLHASAVDVNGAGMVFLGDKGAGKSTTAAAFLSAGHLLLTDDVLAVDQTLPGVAKIQPGFPELKLNPEVLQQTTIEGSVARRSSHPLIEKLHTRVSSRYASAETPTRHVFVLARGSEPKITPLAPADAFAAILRYSYIWRFRHFSRDAQEAQSHFRRCAILAGSTIVARLDIPDDMRRLGEVVELVEQCALG